jgi:hypothetical protein
MDIIAARMNPKPTPGPWRCSKYYVVRDVKNDTPIAFPRLPDPKDLGTEEKANLQLCAAAPELWEACVTTAELLVSGRDMFDAEGRPNQETNALFDRLKAAIARAEEPA